MNVLMFLKKTAPVFMIVVLAFFALNFSSYDAYHELQTFTPNSALATEEVLDTTTATTDDGEVNTSNDSSSDTEKGSGFSFSGTDFSNNSFSFNESFLSGFEDTDDNSGDDSKSSSDSSSSSSGSSSSSSSSSSSGSSFSGTCKVTASADEIYVGSNIDISWVTNGFTKLTLNGEVLNSTSGTKAFYNLQENTTYTLIAKTADEKSSCTSTVKVVCLQNPSPTPTCNLTPSHKIISNGESVELVWTTTNSDLVTLTDYGVVDLNGSVTTGPITGDKTYELEVTGLKGEKISCYSEIEIEKTTPYCELTLTKSVDKDSAKPGDELTYTINIKNTGTADCTGGGVKIVDELDPNINFISETHSGNISAGYGSYPPYQESTRKLFWNGHDLNPGEEGTITWVGKVNKNIACGTEVIVKNKARATARELNYFSKWSYSNIVETKVYESCPVPVPKCDLFSVTPDKITRGDSAELVWKTTNANRVTINNGIGEVNATGTLSVTPLDTTDYLLTVFGKNDQRDICGVTLTVEEPPVEEVPKCVAFSANPFSLPFGGGQSQLNWSTENASLVTINNGIGEVNATGTLSVNISTTTTYILTASDYVKEHSCQVTVAVADPIPAPTCSLAPETVTVAFGGTVDLSWTTTNASSTTLTDFGSVASNGTQNTGILNANKTYVLEVLGINGETIICNSVVTVEAEPAPISCSANVSLSVSPNNIDRGDNATLTWSTTDITAVSFDQGISATGLSGSVSVSPTSDTTYTMTATDGVDTITCPVALDVSSGGDGGGGGSSSPRCELEVSDSKIKKGEEVTLTWDSSRATELKLEDSEGNVLVDTDDYLSDEKDRYFEGKITVSPEVDTVYELVVERGSRDRTCRVEVEVEDDKEDIVITEIRDQQPLISGIALTDVPYTGFEAGPILTSIFYTLLALWSFYIAYFLVVRRDVIGGYRLAGYDLNPVTENKTGDEVIKINDKEDNLEDDTVPKNIFSAPVNLPTHNPVIELESTSNVETSQSDGENTVSLVLNTDEVITQIENHAHLKKVLLSGDAIRYFVTSFKSSTDYLGDLDQIINEAKVNYPTEDGWIVVNENRMRELCKIYKEELGGSIPTIAEEVPTIIPEGSGSLAESIVTGNVVAAYEMIGNRPMFALADAASDLDSVYRARKGSKEIISDLLLKETEKLSDEQLLEMIKALTGALDGTYTDEASAVKMAIMKAVKVVV
ncbi:MAG: hypothetical protein R3B60_03105 [Candidatus Paceibacterota bacterium]